VGVCVGFLFQDLQLSAEVAIWGEMDAKDAIGCIYFAPLDDGGGLIVLSLCG
jgi:hypothetical protein